MTSDNRSLSEKFNDIDRMAEIIGEAGMKAAQESERAGFRTPYWRDNQVVWMFPSEIERERREDSPSEG